MSDMRQTRVSTRSLIQVSSRRWFLQSGLSALGGFTLPQLLQLQAASGVTTSKSADKKSVILFWLSGGPSHLDMWDPKPEAPSEIRGPYRTIATKIPGVQFCEHLPLQASIADKLSVIRSVDCSASNHTPITMQSGNPLARRTDNGRDGDGYPSMGSVAAKFRGANDPDLPPFVGLADSWAADVWESGHMGSDFAPVKGAELNGKFAMPPGIDARRLQDRNDVRSQLDHFSRRISNNITLNRADRYTQQAYDLVMSG
ncbi:MAG: DUF1501 domain-containing protein, partial [Planctomycetaceae bacterium]|nr:DUF1501 domain-containing protein [Planctomycetaceae bacterium]